MIIILVLVGGSAIGGVVKALIEKFGGKDSSEYRKKRTDSKEADRPQPARSGHPPARPARPAHPPARPTHPPARPVATRSEAQPVARPLPTRPIAQLSQGESAAPAIPRPQRRSPPQRPVARPAPETARQTPARPTRQVRVKQPRPARSPAPRPELTLQESMREFDERGSSLVDHHLTTALPSEGVAHPSTELAHPDEQIAEDRTLDLDAIRTPTPRALRQAIIMNEILGPPLALRPGNGSGSTDPFS